MVIIKLSEYAKRTGVTWHTAHRWFHAGKIPGAWQVPSGSIFVPDNIFDEQTGSHKEERTVIYARVSSHEQKEDLERQIQRLSGYCVANGYGVDHIYKEVASGLNDERPQLEKMLRDTSITRIIVEHKDRLTRFGFNYIRILCDINHTDLVVVNKVTEDKDDLVEDFASIITSFCARIYGKRRSKRKATDIQKMIHEDQ